MRTTIIAYHCYPDPQHHQALDPDPPENRGKFIYLDVGGKSSAMRAPLVGRHTLSPMAIKPLDNILCVHEVLSNFDISMKVRS